jgi:CDP-glycerol glycerophosphotransferase
VPACPLISVVIPVHGVEEYLDGCLDSILRQGVEGIEIVAVDDASPDRCGALLDARAGRDARLRVVHREQAGGPGCARNTGLDVAAGEYVWFVDADDLLAEGALRAVGDRLEQDRPDVLLLDYEELYPGGRTAPGPERALLRAAPPGTFTLAEQPRLIRRTMTSWSKVLRREFLRGLAVPFPAGIHEDVPVSCAALLRADRIAALPRVCYRYRRDRRGSFMVTPGDLQFGIFAAYQRVFEVMDCLREAGRPPGGVLTGEVFERAIWHYATVLEANGSGTGRIGGGSLVPRGRRREFFARMSADFKKYRPAGWSYPPGARGVKFRLVERNAYLTYSVLEPVNQLRVRLGRAASRPAAPPGRSSGTPGNGPARDG